MESSQWKDFYSLRKPRKRTEINRDFSFFFIILLQFSFISSSFGTYFDSEGDDYDLDDQSYHNMVPKVIKTVEGQNASLPCKVSLPVNDSPSLILWYINKGETPVYSYDLRGTQNKGGIGWADTLVFGDQRFSGGVRVRFDPVSMPPNLLIQDVRQDDEKLYRCRVDFERASSAFALIDLKVIVPPKEINLLLKRSPVAPNEVNDVVCKVSGAKPPASVIWIQNGQVVDSDYDVRDGTSFNSLEVPASRKDLTNKYICSAQNNDILPLTTTYWRNVTCGPLSMHITSDPNPLSASSFGQLTCVVVGSNPPPLIKWFQRGNLIGYGNVTVSADSNVTTSLLSFSPTWRDHLSQVVCRAENTLRKLATLEDVMTLNVNYAPHLELGYDLPLSADPNLIEEGSDITLECKITSNPQSYKVTWFRDGVLLPRTIGGGLRATGNTLTVYRASRNSSGIYQCSASNVEGDGQSNGLNVSLKYAPVCRHPPLQLGVRLNVKATVACRVDSDPSPESYSWTFISAFKQNEVEEENQKRNWEYTANGTLFFEAKSMKDYGTFKCFANNNIDRQRKPCIVRLTSAGPPNGVESCLIVNVTTDTAGISCKPGFDGGIKQRFQVQVWSSSTSGLVFERTLQDCSYFIVRGLQHSHFYHASVIAYNEHGRAEPKNITITTKRAAPIKRAQEKTRKTPKNIVIPTIPSNIFIEKTNLESNEPTSTDGAPVAFILGIIVLILLITLVALMVVRWALKRPAPNPFPLRNISGKKSSVKEQGTLLTGKAEESPMNGGVFEYTIYDSTGRYRGFSNLPPQVPGFHYPTPVASRAADIEDASAGHSKANSEGKLASSSNCADKANSNNISDADNCTGTSVRLKNSKGWTKIRGVFVFIRSSNYRFNFKRIVTSRNREPAEVESKI